MATFLSVHGYDPGPSQRPLLPGHWPVFSGQSRQCLSSSGSARSGVEAKILHFRRRDLALGWAAMAIAGAVYARMFGRAANNARGGWLFGMVFGFALWAAGAVLFLPLVSGGRAPAGRAALGVALSLLAWGLPTGILVPFVHRPLHESSKRAARHADVGPDAAAGKNQPIREQRHLARISNSVGVVEGTRWSVLCA